ENQEKRVAEYIYNLLKEENIPVELKEVLKGRFNVTAYLKGEGGGKSLMLSGHLDTVPPYDMENPFTPVLKDGVLYGRGACDMKGPVSAMLLSLIALKRSGISLKGDVFFTGVIDEEEKGKGAEHLVKNGPFTDGAIIGEPTDMKIAVGHKGLEWIKVKVTGKKVHGGRMDEGINAIEMASKFIERIYDEYVPKLKERHHEILGQPTINIGKITGGDQPSTVPGECIIEIDRRWIPIEAREQVYEELNQIINDLKLEVPGFNADLSDMFTEDNLLSHKPFFTDKDDPIVKAAKEALTGKNKNTEETVFPAWSDAGTIAAYTNTKCIIMGPGDLRLAHSKDESIKVKDLTEAARIYTEIIMDYCEKA
ncbi:MAG: M20 family metallopeptidase, partial [Clostridiales bacterium]|nr:M20 family metallopeptidase [Clostridiales bacterium]